jgi:hypothetical protein
VRPGHRGFASRRARALDLPLALVLLACLGACGVRAPAPPANGIAGTIVSTDDTGLPDSPSGGGWIVAIPAEHTEDVVTVARKRHKDLRLRDLPHAGFVLDDRTVKTWGAVLAEVDDDGRFTMVVTGPHLFCRVEEGNTGKRLARGCDDVSPPAGGTVRATVGEAGFRVGLV